MEFEVPSDSGGKVHHITVIFRCDCLGYRYCKGKPEAKTCKHIRSIQTATQEKAA